MAAHRVTGLDGSEWTVRRRWVHRRVRWRGKGGDALSGLDLAWAADDLSGFGIIGAVFAAIAIGLVAVLFVFPALIFLLELLLILLLVALGVAGKVLFRRPWTVEARQRGADHVYEWKVVGWRASGDVMAEVATHIQASGQPIGGVRRPPTPTTA